MTRHHPYACTEEWTGSMQDALPSQTVLTMTYWSGTKVSKE